MQIQTPEQAVELLDDAFNRRDLDALLEFYDDEAVVVTAPGRLARGKAEIRAAFAELMEGGGVARQQKTQVIETGGFALFLSYWTFTVPAADGASTSTQFMATAVFRKDASGVWRLLIDNALGPLVLEGETPAK